MKQNIKWAVRDNTWDPTIMGHVFTRNHYQLPDDMTGVTFVDIGAHIGTVAILAATHGANVIAYEPAKGSFELLKMNIENNDVKNITAVNKGVGKAGQAILYIDAYNTGQCTVYKDLSGFKIDSAEIIEKVPLAEVLKDIDDCFLKLDCEGCEVEVIPEIIDGLYKKIHTMIIEFHFMDTAEELMKTLEPFYKIEQFYYDEYKFYRK